MKEMFWAFEWMILNNQLNIKIINWKDDEKLRNRLKLKGSQHESLGSLETNFVILHQNSVRKICKWWSKKVWGLQGFVVVLDNGLVSLRGEKKTVDTSVLIDLQP